MRIIGKEEAVAWLSSNGLAPPEQSKFFGPHSISLTYRIPADSGKKTVLSRALLSLFASEQDCILLITEFGIWPECEDMTLFNGFRRILGETSTLEDKPAHLFSSEDLGQVASLLGMTLYFVWGALLCSARGNVMVEVSHDEMMDITVPGDERELQRVRDSIEPVAGSPTITKGGG